MLVIDVQLVVGMKLGDKTYSPYQRHQEVACVDVLCRKRLSVLLKTQRREKLDPD